MRVLVLAQDYPTENNRYAMNFVHTRNLEYKKHDLEVTVLSFNTNISYVYDSIEVLSEEEAVNKDLVSKADIIVSHAPNIRNHLRFLKKQKEHYSKLVMFFHGHEVMKMNKYYPEPYSFMTKSKKSKKVQFFYDLFKLSVMRRFLKSQIVEKRIHMVFVSQWMRDVFIENVHLSSNDVEKNSDIIPNAMNDVFLETSYRPKPTFKADFITIRPLDNSKYGVDLVVKLAEKHPHLSFHIYGTGRMFEYVEKPSNIKVFNEFLKPNDLAEVLNNYRCAIMPTRLDAQGVMMCEIASYGMPIITSDLTICKEMLNGFPNAYFFDNENLNISLEEVLENARPVHSESLKEAFSLEKTTMKEIELFKRLEKN